MGAEKEDTKAEKEAVEGKEEKRKGVDEVSLSDLEFRALHRVDIRIGASADSRTITLRPDEPWDVRAAASFRPGADASFSLPSLYQVGGLFRDTNRDLVADETAAFISLKGSGAPGGGHRFRHPHRPGNGRDPTPLGEAGQPGGMTPRPSDSPCSSEPTTIKSGAFRRRGSCPGPRSVPDRGSSSSSKAPSATEMPWPSEAGMMRAFQPQPSGWPTVRPTSGPRERGNTSWRTPRPRSAAFSRPGKRRDRWPWP